MADGVTHENDGHPGKRRPDQAIYRPGMFKRGIDLTQTAPRPENHPPPSERRLQQQLRKQQDREREDRASTGQVFYPPNQRNNSQYRSLPPTSRDRLYRDNLSQSNGHQGRTFSRGGRGGGGYRPRDNSFDSRSVRSGKKQNFRPNKKYPFDTQSEMGAQNDDTQSIASSTFSTDTTIYNNGFASELNSRNPSIQSLLNQDIQSFDWADLMADEVSDRTTSQLAQLPETDSNGMQEDDLSSEQTGASTPRKLSVDQQSTIDRSLVTTTQQRTSDGGFAGEKIPTVAEEEADKEMSDLATKMEQLNAKENHMKPSTSEETPEPATPVAFADKQPFAEISNKPEIVSENIALKPSIDEDDEFETTSLKQSIQRAFTCLYQLQEKLQAIFRQSALPEVVEAEIISYLKEASNIFSQSLRQVIQLRETSPCSSEEFKKCALDAMKVRSVAEKSVQLLAVRKHNYVLTYVTDITMKALYVVSALIVYDLEQARKFQLIEAFEAIWQKLISRVKMQITAFGKNIVIQLITLIRSSITTVSEHLEIESQIGELARAVISTDFCDFTQAVHVSPQAVIFDVPQITLSFASNAYRWNGDLARYQSMILGSSDYNPSLKFYFLSFVLDPQNGTALNQMGAVASYKSSRRRSLARRRFGRRLSGLDEKQEPSELLNAVFLFCHALTTGKPFTACESKLLSLLSSPFENGHDADTNMERLEFVQHFLSLAKKAFTGEEEDLQLIVDKVLQMLTEVFIARREMNVFTSADFVYQTGILWSLIRMDRVKAEQKDYLKHMLVKYTELLGSALLDVQADDDVNMLQTNIAFIASPLAILTQFWPHIGGGKLPGLSALPDFDRLYSPSETTSYVVLPEFLLLLHGDPEFSESSYLTPISYSAEPSHAATVIRLSIIKDFFIRFSS